MTQNPQLHIGAPDKNTMYQVIMESLEKLFRKVGTGKIKAKSITTHDWSGRIMCTSIGDGKTLYKSWHTYYIRQIPSCIIIDGEDFFFRAITERDFIGHDINHFTFAHSGILYRWSDKRQENEGIILTIQTLISLADNIRYIEETKMNEESPNYEWANSKDGDNKIKENWKMFDELIQSKLGYNN